MKRFIASIAVAVGLLLSLGGAPAHAQNLVVDPCGTATRTLTYSVQGTVDLLGQSCISSYAKTVTATVTRPNNTTTYTASTAWANATSGATYGTLSGVCPRNGAHVYLNDVYVVDKANQTTKLQGTLFLFSAVPTAINDNAAFNLNSADWDTVKPPLAFTLAAVLNASSGASGAVSIDVPASIEIGCATGDTNLYFMIRVDNAYVPVANEVLKIAVKVLGVN